MRLLMEIRSLHFLDHPAAVLGQDEIGGRAAAQSAPGATHVHVVRLARVGRFADGATVADIMTPVVYTLPESATLSRAAALMAFEGLHRLPVVSTENRVVGIITSLDVARWLARNDGYIAPGSSDLARRGDGETE